MERYSIIIIIVASTQLSSSCLFFFLFFSFLFFAYRFWKLGKIGKHFCTYNCYSSVLFIFRIKACVSLLHIYVHNKILMLNILYEFLQTKVMAFGLYSLLEVNRIHQNITHKLFEQAQERRLYLGK
jgi:hypothetical protein